MRTHRFTNIRLLIALLCSVLVCWYAYNYLRNHPLWGDADVDDIRVSELLLFSIDNHAVEYLTSNNHDIEYCKILRNALEGDEDAIQKLFLLEIHDAAGYDHGDVLVHVVARFGEDKIILSLRSLNYKQKRSVESYLKAGLEYGNVPLQLPRDLNKAFPKLSAFLNIK